MEKKISLLAIALGLVIFCSGQTTGSKKTTPPKNTCVNYTFANSSFASGESLTYAMSYTLMFIWTDVGEVTFTATDDTYLGKDALHFRAVGKSYPFYDNFFKVRDVYEAWVHPKTLKPFYFNREVDEGGYTINNIYTFDWKTNLLYAYIKRKNRPEKHDTLAVLPCSIDIVSVLYYCRNIDYSSAKINQKFPISLALDDELYTVLYRYQGKEEIDVKGLGRFRCLKFGIGLVKGSVFSGKEELTLWVTDDDNKIPIYIESPIKVGTVRGRVIGMKNLKYPLTSKVQK
ncbi:DUF3108 domain-containing protein [Williamwhitmania taraxaci]|uniref:DUF3108 domain-containing protein n=1 Tax=Williamwhitmania taraxaci TaxID=1640674 RepID=A0A1G6M5L3_9BACT|nr:DUF3108 domain-containing protein [Williamwhitmania taraxaci]SDC50842.1 Protein of unknown function [Williamwhitmania taraxaci]